MASLEFPDLLYPEYLTYSNQPHEILLDQWPTTTMVSGLYVLNSMHFYEIL